MKLYKNFKACIFPRVNTIFIIIPKIKSIITFEEDDLNIENNNHFETHLRDSAKIYVVI